ncbi:MAG: hypothetical protein EPO68_02000 [Planctomycetota bacterium]|nr:MAG: hypothetical protein EPO68_02000 [Planctomycetota bacterium]
MSYPRLLAVVASILLGIGTCLCWYLDGTKPQVVNAASPWGPSNARVVPGSAGYAGQAPKGSAYRANGHQRRIGQVAPRTSARMPLLLKPVGGAPAAALTPTVPTSPAIGTGAVAPSEG